MYLREAEAEISLRMAFLGPQTTVMDSLFCDWEVSSSESITGLRQRCKILDPVR